MTVEDLPIPEAQKQAIWTAAARAGVDELIVTYEGLDNSYGTPKHKWQITNAEGTLGMCVVSDVKVVRP